MRVSDNHADHETRVRERAYKLWEENGRPRGRDIELWEQARQLVAIEENPCQILQAPTRRGRGRRSGHPRELRRSSWVPDRSRRPARDAIKANPTIADRMLRNPFVCELRSQFGVVSEYTQLTREPENLRDR